MTAETVPPRRWPRIALVVLLVLIAVLWIGGRTAQYLADGPWELIPGGELRSGELITEPVSDWSFVHGETVELQLVNPLKSRYTGLMVHEGELYVPCDLGYMWGRFSGNIRRTLHLVYLFKRWHEDAVEDGRVVFRVDGKRYARQAVRVTDPALVAALKSDLEALARKWLHPRELGPPPTEGPRDIWFFRLDPRPLG